MRDVKNPHLVGILAGITLFKASSSGIFPHGNGGGDKCCSTVDLGIRAGVTLLGPWGPRIYKKTKLSLMNIHTIYIYIYIYICMTFYILI